MLSQLAVHDTDNFLRDKIITLASLFVRLFVTSFKFRRKASSRYIEIHHLLGNMCIKSKQLLSITGVSSDLWFVPSPSSSLVSSVSYTSMAPDPTSDIFRGSCTPILWFVFSIGLLFVIFVISCNTPVAAEDHIRSANHYPNYIGLTGLKLW